MPGTAEQSAQVSAETADLVVRGAPDAQPQNIDLRLPTGKLVVITSVSGSGESSLAFDTIYAEGQRRCVESLSAYARQFLERMEKPDVDAIEGIAPAIAIRQKAASAIRARLWGPRPRFTITCGCCSRASAARSAGTAGAKVIRETAKSWRVSLANVRGNALSLLGFDLTVIETKVWPAAEAQPEVDELNEAAVEEGSNGDASAFAQPQETPGVRGPDATVMPPRSKDCGARRLRPALIGDRAVVFDDVARGLDRGPAGPAGGRRSRADWRGRSAPAIDRLDPRRPIARVAARRGQSSGPGTRVTSRQSPFVL